jgi:mannose-6-phosphate isomerase-like protein (cupin superfamily)
MPRFDSRILKILKEQVVDYNNYKKYKLVGIGEQSVHGRVYINGAYAQDNHSFATWLRDYKKYHSVQVLGLENNKKLMSAFKKIKKFDFAKLQDICAFYSPNNNFSFDKHKDVVNVILYVVKGRKKVYLGNKIQYVNAGQWVYIPKGTYHKVYNKKDTWAVSFGFV